MNFFKPTLLLFLGLTFFAQLNAQESKNDTTETPNKWAKTWVIGINGSQASYNNWSQGGVSSVSGAASSVYENTYTNQKFVYKFVKNFKYGQIRNEGQDLQKTDDQILIRNSFEYKLTAISSLIGNVNFQSQFAPGYDTAADTRIKISDFFAPAYINENIGYALTPGKTFNAQIGAGLKQTIVSISGLETLYGVKEGEQIRFEAGLNVGISFTKTLAPNVNLNSQFESFSNLQVSLKSTDFIFRNEITGKINDFMNTNFQFAVMYDDDFSDELQVKQVLSVGITWKIH